MLNDNQGNQGNQGTKDICDCVSSCTMYGNVHLQNLVNVQYVLWEMVVLFI